MIGLAWRLMTSRLALISAGVLALVGMVRFAAPEAVPAEGSIQHLVSRQLSELTAQVPPTLPRQTDEPDTTMDPRPLVLIDHLPGDMWLGDRWLVTATLRDLIRLRNRWRIPDDDLWVRLSRQLGHPDSATALDQTQRLAAIKQAQADAMLIGRIDRIGVEPDGQAELGLTLHLIDPAGDVIWSSSLTSAEAATDTPTGRGWSAAAARLLATVTLILALPLLLNPVARGVLRQQSNAANAGLLLALVAGSTLLSWPILGISGWASWPLLAAAATAALAWNGWVLARWERGS